MRFPAWILLLEMLFPSAAQGRILRFVTLVYRHGDRSPLSTYPTDPHKAAAWPHGFQQLSEVGILQQKALGEIPPGKIHWIFESFLQTTRSDSLHGYLLFQIYVRSTDYDRTIMSAQANLMGLYPNSHPEIPWKPVPIHTVPAKYDKLLKPPTRTCQRYQQLMEETINLPSYQAKLTEWKGFMEKMANYTGLKSEQLTLRGLWKVHDTLFCQKTHNMSLPSWATAQVLATLSEIEVFNIEAHVGMHAAQEKARFIGGLLLGAILSNFSKMVCQDLPLKMIMYSAHDSTLIALQAALGVYNGHLPPYAACHGFEFYQESNNSFSVAMFYRNTSDQRPHILPLPGCPTPCPLPLFIHLTRIAIPKDWDAECQNLQSGPGHAVIALAAAVGVLSVALLGMGVLYWRR